MTATELRRLVLAEVRPWLYGNDFAEAGSAQSVLVGRTPNSGSHVSPIPSLPVPPAPFSGLSAEGLAEYWRLHRERSDFLFASAMTGARVPPEEWSLFQDKLYELLATEGLT